MITWTATDWCCAEELPEREYEFTQKVIARIDPECVLNGGEDVSLVQGSAHSELGSVIDEVTVRAIPESGSALSVVTSGAGLFEFSVPTHTDMSLIPEKSHGFSAGSTTCHWLLIQRHLFGTAKVE